MKKLKISIIVPCFNMSLYIRDTLDSIINQKYENYELIVVDGGSTDGTIDIIKEYHDNITIFISESDKGQYDAINKGMKLANGDILCWLNADDIYFRWTLKMVSFIFNKFNDVMWITGSPSFTDKNNYLTKINCNVGGKPKSYIANGFFNDKLYGFLQQENMFWRKKVWETCGPLNNDYSLASDFELWTKFAKKHDLVSISIPLASFRMRFDSRSKTGINKYNEEVKLISQPFKKKKILTIISSKHQVLNKLIRLLTWKKSKVVYYSTKNQKWIYKKTYRPISTISFSNLLLEIDFL